MVFAAAVARTGKSRIRNTEYLIYLITDSSLIVLPSALFGADSLSELFSDDERFSFLSKAKHHSFDSHGLGWQLQVSPSIASQCVGPFSAHPT